MHHNYSKESRCMIATSIDMSIDSRIKLSKVDEGKVIDLLLGSLRYLIWTIFWC